jgi:hypothetical protein
MSNNEELVAYENWPCFMAILDGKFITHFMVPETNPMAIAAWRSNPIIVETVWHKLPLPGSVWNGSLTDPQFTPGE